MRKCSFDCSVVMVAMNGGCTIPTKGMPDCWRMKPKTSCWQELWKKAANSTMRLKFPGYRSWKKTPNRIAGDQMTLSHQDLVQVIHSGMFAEHRNIRYSWRRRRREKWGRLILLYPPRLLR
ncbi:uncharacterized protein [Anabrus simplex]|uniref:uncharacterized protein n=1 Tax=Anabrus simplex TaxID=316456 RepID=UPI0035A2620F